MDDVVTLILGGGRGTRLFPLTHMRSKPAVPTSEAVLHSTSTPPPSAGRARKEETTATVSRFSVTASSHSGPNR